MEEYNKSYGANNHTSSLSHAQSLSQFILFLLCLFLKQAESTFECCLLSFLPQIKRVVTQFRRKHKFIDFRKANEPVKCHFIFKYSLKKAKEKILNPPKTANEHPVVVLEISILQAYILSLNCK